MRDRGVNQEKALVGAFSVIVQPVVELMDRFAALVLSPPAPFSTVTLVPSSGSCRLLCPGKEQEVARDCIESSCCRERLGSRQPVEEIDIRTQL